jgi:hypothetical protein
MIKTSCPYSSIVFLILALVIDNFIYKLLFLQLCISSTIFHMYDHEIFPEQEIYNIYYYDMLSILLLGLFILTKNIFITILFAIIIILLFKKINRFAVLFYIIGLIKIIYVLFKKENIILITTILIIAAIAHYDHSKKYNFEPYHNSWKPYNALIWHICNACILYLYLK